MAAKSHQQSFSHRRMNADRHYAHGRFSNSIDRPVG